LQLLRGRVAAELGKDKILRSRVEGSISPARIASTGCYDLFNGAGHHATLGLTCSLTQFTISSSLEPGVILLDEPTSFLDLKYKKEIFDLIAGLTSEKGLALVVVSHDIDLVSQYCHRIVMLKQPALHLTGIPDQVIDAASIESVYECAVLVDRNAITGKPRVSLKP